MEWFTNNPRLVVAAVYPTPARTDDQLDGVREAIRELL